MQEELIREECYIAHKDSDPLLPNLFEEACNKYSEVISKVPLLRLNALFSKPVVLLPCKYKTYFECISNKSKLCLKSPSYALAIQEYFSGINAFEYTDLKSRFPKKISWYTDT